MRTVHTDRITRQLMPMNHAMIATVLAGLCGSNMSLAQSPPDIIRLEGTVRDFKTSHPDFGVTPTGGNGHYAGNVHHGLNGLGRPMFSGTGFKVNTQWRDAQGRQIAPHLYYNSGVLMTGSAPQTSTDVVIDSWNSSAGAYGGSNVGDPPPMLYPVTFPTITAPTGLPQTYGANASFAGTVTLSSSFRANSLATGQGAIINISGHMEILVSGVTSIAKNTQILLQPNSSLAFYGGSDISIGQASAINMNTLDPRRCRIYNLSNKPIVFNQSGKVCAQVFSPAGPMQLKQDDEFYGVFLGSQLILDQGSGFHWDGMPMDVCGTLIADIAGTQGTASTGGITSTATFNHWYTDVLGTNLSSKHSIELARNESGVYEFDDDKFFPIDNQLFGNEGKSHNYHFTFTIRTSFVHEACKESFFEFQGADDAWLFIDGKLALDLGGVLPNTLQHVQIDRLGLVHGQSYTFEFFYAQRQETSASLRMRTNLSLQSNESYETVSAGVD